ncbi:hypothetical protein, partial [Aeromonas caviae]|uniref:hypothetical protein n=1 Tax=Aeromonas caviae TaxID=648 RepID=UPI001FBB62F9
LSYIALQSGQFHQSVSQIQQQLKQHFGLSFSRGAISVSIHRNSIDTGKMRRSSLDPTFLLA